MTKGTKDNVELDQYIDEINSIIKSKLDQMFEGHEVSQDCQDYINQFQNNALAFIEAEKRIFSKAKTAQAKNEVIIDFNIIIGLLKDP